MRLEYMEDLFYRNKNLQSGFYLSTDSELELKNLIMNRKKIAVIGTGPMAAFFVRHLEKFTEWGGGN